MMQAFNQYRNDIKNRRLAAKLSNQLWDGRAEWQPMKQSLSTESHGYEWSHLIGTPERAEFYVDVMKLEEVRSVGTMNELNHFIMQCARIPILDKVCPRKIGQIALNVGQLLAEIELVQLSDEQANLIARFHDLGMTEYQAYCA